VLLALDGHARMQHDLLELPSALRVRYHSAVSRP
jgi:hypothetical protein